MNNFKTKYEYWDNGNIKDEWKNGTHIRRWENGNKWIKCSYAPNLYGTYIKKDGIYKLWYARGNIREICRYKNGKKNGLYESWHRNGKKFIKCTYKNGLEDGLYEWWDYNGNQFIRCTYVSDEFETEGKKDGLYEEWWVSNSFETNGNQRIKCFYKNNKMVGPYKELHDNGILYKKCSYVLIEPKNYSDYDGSYEEWDCNGNMQIKSTFKKGNLLGLCVWWDINDDFCAIQTSKTTFLYKINRSVSFIKRTHTYGNI